MSTGTAPTFSVRRAAVAAVCIMLICLGGALFSVRAYAAFTPIPATGNGILQIDSDPYPARLAAIGPGESKELQLQVKLQGAPSGSLSMQLRGSGPLVERAVGLNIAVATCPSAFVGATSHRSCATGGQLVLRTAPLASVATSTSSSSWVLKNVVRGNARFLLVTLSMPQDAAESRAITGLPGSFGIGLYAAGDETATGPIDRPPLADTGLDLAGPLLIAIGVLGLGLVIRASRRASAVFGDAQAGGDA